MSNFEMTQEEIQASINAAFDSVNLINDLNSKESLTTEEFDTVERNISHLEIMMAKNWFSSALTSEQNAAIQACIQLKSRFDIL